MYDLEKFKTGGYFIRIETKEKYDMVMEWLERFDIRFRTGERATRSLYWGQYLGHMAIKYDVWSHCVGHQTPQYFVTHGYIELNMEPKTKGEEKMTTKDRNMKELYGRIDKVYFNEEKRTTVIKFKDGETVKSTASEDTEFSEYFGFVSAMMKHQFGKVENIETFIKRKGVRQ